MAKTKQKDPFWTSYSDLMTSLFFVMLVLFIICLVKVGRINGDLKTANGQLELALNQAIADKNDLQNILQYQENVLCQRFSRKRNLRT